jgi:hypothetical protein
LRGCPCGHIATHSLSIGDASTIAQNTSFAKTCFRIASETAAKLDLELVLTAPNGAAFVLMFQGTPLPKTSLKVYGPPKWEKPLRTNDQGQITVPTPWAGRYVLKVVYVEEKVGEIDGLKFDRTRHVSTLSFVEQDGVPWSANRWHGFGAQVAWTYTPE